MLLGAPAIVSTVDAHLELKSSPCQETPQWKALPENSVIHPLTENPSSDSFWGWTHSCAQAVNLDDQSLDLQITRGWNLTEGLGSSSAIFLAFQLLHEEFSPQFWNALSLQERFQYWRAWSPKLKELQSGGSGLDLLAQICGGSVLVAQEAKSVEAIDLKIPSEMLVIHTGHKAKTRDELKKRGLSSVQCKTIADSVMRFATSPRSLDNWILATKEHHALFSEFGTVPDLIESAFGDWTKNFQMFAGKTTGAGGGDTLLVFSPTSQHAALIADIKRRGWWVSHRPWGVPGALLS